MQARFPDFFHYMFVHHQFERYTAQGFNNARPFWFLFAAFAGTTLPWCIFLVPAARGQAKAGDAARQVPC